MKALLQRVRSASVEVEGERVGEIAQGLLVLLGLDKGGSCQGVALRFDPAQRDTVIAYLNERELTGYAYQPAIVTAGLEGGRSVAVYTFVTDPDHPQYAGDLGVDRSAEMIMAASGQSGLKGRYPSVFSTRMRFPPVLPGSLCGCPWVRRIGSNDRLRSARVTLVRWKSTRP